MARIKPKKARPKRAAAKTRPAKTKPAKQKRPKPLRKTAKKIPEKAAKKPKKPEPAAKKQVKRPAEKPVQIAEAPLRQMISAPSAVALLPAPTPEPKPETSKPGTQKAQPPLQPPPQPIEPVPPPEAKKPPAAKPQAPKPAELKPYDHREGTAGPLAVQIDLALETLPEWEDRGRLKRVIFEDGLAFFALSNVSPEFTEANSLLSQSKHPAIDAPGHFIVCVKDRGGKIVGALDGHLLSENTLWIDRSCVLDDKKRELHILLYCAALSGKSISFVLCSADKEPPSVQSAGKFILFGRGFGMSAIPFNHPKSVYFVRRVGKELYPLSTGQEIAKVLGELVRLGDHSLEPVAADFANKESVALVPLPTSPDSREHLHELRDFFVALGLPTGNLQAIMDELRVQYVTGRTDITPQSI